MRHLEEDMQAAAVKWFDLQFRSMSRMLFAVPNGGRRNVREAARLKRCGVRAGISDLILLVPSAGYNSLCIEMKVDKGKQTCFQREWQELAEKHGNKYIICRSFEDFQAEILHYLGMRHLVN